MLAATVLFLGFVANLPADGNIGAGLMVMSVGLSVISCVLAGVDLLVRRRGRRSPLRYASLALLVLAAALFAEVGRGVAEGEHIEFEGKIPQSVRTGVGAEA